MFFQLIVLICLSFSSSFRVTPSLVHPFLEGISLDAALKSLRLFIVDYSILEKADVDSERAVSFVCEPLRSKSEASPTIWSCYANLNIALFISLEIDSLYGL